MKYYKKYINEQLSVKPHNKIIIVKDGMLIINPDELLILEDGWEEYIIPDKTLDDYKQEKIEEIMYYDSSTNVNEFYIHNIPVWLDKSTRAGLKLRFEAEINLGKTDTTLWYGNLLFPLNLEDAVKMLYDIEIYASACYDNTLYHLSLISKLTSVEEILEYDYKVGYPLKLTF